MRVSEGLHSSIPAGKVCNGGAIIPVLQGVAADAWGIQLAFFVPLLCYTYVAYYGIKGHIPAYKKG
jgi:MFS transporter, FHS family, L-fucose permease